MKVDDNMEKINMDEIIHTEDIDMNDDLLIHDINPKKDINLENTLELNIPNNLERTVEIKIEDNYEQNQ